MSGRADQSRVTVVEKVYYQSGVQSPKSIETAFTLKVKSDEQPYERRFMLTNEWKSIDTGWIDEISLLLIRNEGRPITNGMPTDEEKQKRLDAIIEVKHSQSCMAEWTIEPGQDMRGKPSDLKALQLRCAGEHTFCTITLYPQ